MGFREIAWALRQRTGNGAANAVLVRLADHANSDRAEAGEDSCFPSIRTLAEETEFNHKTVAKAITALAELGLIEVRKRVTKTGRFNSYTLRLDVSYPPTSNPDSGVSPNQGVSPNLGVPPNLGAGVSPNLGAGVHPNLGDKPIREPVREPIKICTSESSDGSRPEVAAPAVRPETVTVSPDDVLEPETPKGKRSKKARKQPQSNPLTSPPIGTGITQEAWDSWLGIRKAKKFGPPDPYAWSLMVDQVKLSDLTLPAAIDYCIRHRWAGFESKWWFEKEGRTPPTTGDLFTAPPPAPAVNDDERKRRAALVMGLAPESKKEDTDK